GVGLLAQELSRGPERRLVLGHPVLPRARLARRLMAQRSGLFPRVEPRSLRCRRALSHARLARRAFMGQLRCAKSRDERCCRRRSWCRSDRWRRPRRRRELTCTSYGRTMESGSEVPSGVASVCATWGSVVPATPRLAPDTIICWSTYPTHATRTRA